MTGGLVFGLGCLGVSLILPLDLPLDFQTRISDQFTKNAIYRRGPCQDLYSNFSGNHEVLLPHLHLSGLWAQAHFAQIPLTSVAP